MGRPSTYSDETAATICERIAAGESVRGICSGDDMPAASTVFKWLADNSTFAEQYAHAREEQAETMAGEIVAIADDETLPSDSRRIKIDARKWVAAKLRPKVYGEKLDVKHDGQVTVNILKFADRNAA